MYSGANLRTTVALIALAASAGASAQEKPNGNGGIEEIIVTARKRAESIQDVPLSITSMTSENLERSGVVDFVDYGTRVPSLSFGNTGDGAAGSRTIAIRGVSGDNTTGFYIDETPVTDSVDPKIVDVARIEVLRGPQGTLYGARSLGGTVRVITKQPDPDRHEGEVRASLSSTKEGGWNYLVSGALNVPLASGVAARFTGVYEQESGIFDRIVQGPGTPVTVRRKNIDDRETYGFQVAVRFEPAPDLAITPRVLYQRTVADGLPYADFRAGNFEQFRFFDVAEVSRDRWTLYSADARYDVGFGSFVSSTSYFDRHIFEREDQSEFIAAVFGLDPPLLGTVSQALPYKRFVQEIRFASDFEGPLQFIVGGFYSDLKDGEIFDPPALTAGLDAALGGLLGTDNAFSGRRRTRTKEPAVFGELSFALTERLTATAGLRWYEIKIDDRYDFDGFFVGGPGFVAQKQKEDGLNPKFLVEYQAGEDRLLYASAARGFRPGGVNVLVPELLCGAELDTLGISREQIRTFASDKLWSYEVGAKTSWLDRRLTVNGAAYLISWPDIQQVQRLQCGFFFTGNAGKAESKGFELEVQAVPIDALTLDLGVGYIDAEFVKAGATLAAPEGTPIFQTPKWTVSASAHWQQPVGTDVEGFAHADFRYIGSSLSANNPDLSAAPGEQFRRRDAYSLLDLRAGILWKRTEFAAFIKNAINEAADFADSRSLAAETPGRPRIVTNRPRTIGFEVRTRF